ncbi:DNA-formamidopyrimidine glycosylase family protein, partial [Candidatus Bipolaricaulota bacterium]
MPELPELDVMQEVLTTRIVGRTIVAARSFHPGILKTVEPALDSLIGKRFTAISRRAKHLIFTLDDTLHVVIHLMLAGRLISCQ